jgi:hypothetical protein
MLKVEDIEELTPLKCKIKLVKYKVRFDEEFDIFDDGFGI